MAKWELEYWDSSDKSVTFLEALREANTKRQALWPGADKVDVLFRAVEFSGEAGELLNAVKKMYRAMNSITGNSASIEDIKTNLEEEFGDVLSCLDLLANEFGVDLEKATINKFNKVSKKVGIDVFL